jgi:hypothetical protein
VAVDARANPPTVTLRAGGIRQTYPIERNAVILRGASGARSSRAEIAELQPGDTAQLRVDEGSGAATLVEAQFRGAGEPSQPTRPDGAPERLEIRSFTHNASGWLRAGSMVELSLRGTPGAVVTAEVGSIARNVSLREDPQNPGRYVGKFEVPTGVTAQDVPVIASLERGGKQAPLVQSGTSLRIDAEPPKISGASPAGGERTSNQRPNIYVNLEDEGGSGLQSGSFRMAVKGKDVTEDAKVTPSFAIYTPESLPEGPVNVEVEVRDEAGNPARAVWSFTVAAASSLIRSVTHNAEQPLGAGDSLTVRMQGQPGGQATFDVGEVARGLAMKEESAGNYIGTYTVRRGDQALKAPVTVHLKAGAERSSQPTTAPVAIVTQDLAAPRITAPAAGTPVAQGFVVTGEATPGSKVVVEVLYSGKALGLLAVQGTAGTQEVATDQNGKFRTEPFQLELPPGLSVPSTSSVPLRSIPPASARSPRRWR